MIIFFKKIRLIFLVSLIAILSMVGLTIPDHHAQAQLPVIDAGTASLVVKEYILDPAVRVLINTLLKTMTDEVLGWITGDEGRNVGFIKNLEQTAKDEVDLRAGEFLNHLAGVNLCSANLRAYLQMHLGLLDGNFRFLNAQLSCKLTGIVDNIDRFYENFENGGWPAFISVGIIPENNYWGASLIAQQNMQFAQGSVANVLNQKIQANGWFQGVQLTKKSEHCEVLKDEEGMDEMHCYTEKEVTTPGKLISESLGKSIKDTPFDNVVSSDELSEMLDQFMSTVVNALINQLISGKLF